MMNYFIKNDGICIKNDEFCITTDGFWIKNDEFCIKNDELCIKNDGLRKVELVKLKKDGAGASKVSKYE